MDIVVEEDTPGTIGKIHDMAFTDRKLIVLDITWLGGFISE